MDWSKAVNILIIALLVTCLVLGGILLTREISEKNEDKSAALSAAEYLVSRGASLNCDIQLNRPSLPVLFVRFEAVSVSDSAFQLTSYNGIEVAFDSRSTGYFPVLVSAGKAKAKVISASSALLKALALAENTNGLIINNIKLVYYIDPDSFIPDSEDTAIPCWIIETSRGYFSINAYEQ